jgi:hypothetical protein
MRAALKLDPAIASIAHLPPGWSAWRSAKGGAWKEYQNEDD